MSVFSKIFGSASKKIAGDEGRILVPVYLDSIAAGANPKIQVEKIRAIVGDSNEEFKGFLDELAMAGDEKPEVIAKAVDIMKKFYNEKMAGDEDPSKKDEDSSKKDKKPAGGEDPSKKDKKPADGDDSSKEDKKPTGDEDPSKKEAGDGCMGRLSGDEIDAIAQKTAAIMLAAQSKAESKTAGDEQMEPPAMPLAGDAGTSGKSSDDFMKEIF